MRVCELKRWLARWREAIHYNTYSRGGRTNWGCRKRLSYPGLHFIGRGLLRRQFRRCRNNSSQTRNDSLFLHITLSILYPNILKPFIDVLISLVILFITSPIFLIIVLILYFDNNGKVWFKQERPGRNGKIFSVIKFKTMTDERDDSGTLLPDERRLSTVGKLIRKTSLDELPQLLNVILGHMSLVGPRPLLKEYLPLYNDFQRRRHEVRPGITGWAQVNGRNTVLWPQKFAYDVWYVDHISFWLDIKILFLTVMKVFKAEGISSSTSVTMEKFHGNN